MDLTMLPRLLIAGLILLHFTPTLEGHLQYAVIIPSKIQDVDSQLACFHVSGAEGQTNVTLSLTTDEGTTPLIEKTFEEESLFSCLPFQLSNPITNEDVATMEISINTSTEIIVNQTKVLLLKQRTGILVQTDKSIYKPGQTVNFRVVSLKENLQPLLQQIPFVEFQDPEKNRIGQWLNVKPNQGISDFSFVLSSEPILGEYTIKVKDTVHHFSVEEYVLPKFEVSMLFPSVVLLNSESFTVKLCGRYTYGKPMQGVYQGIVCQRSNSYMWHWMHHIEPLKDLCHNFTGRLDRSGCDTIVMKSEHFQLDSTRYQTSLEGTASVVEDGTGIELSTSGSVQISNELEHLSFVDAVENYKPGIPYSATLRLEDVSRHPIPNESIYVQCTTGYNEETQTIVTDNNGFATFNVKNTTGWIGRISIKARTNLQDYGYRSFSIQPQYGYAYLSLLPFYSPSKSFLSLQSETKNLPCEGQQEVQVEYLIKHTELNPDTKKLHLHYLTVSKAFIWNSGTVKIRVKNFGQDLTGTTSFSFPVTSDVAPNLRVFVYVLLPSGEMVADSAKFTVQRCFKNKVSVQFSPGEVLPGSDVSFKLRADPGSLCGLRAVDQSVVLMKPEKELTADKVHSLFRSFDFGGYDYRIQEPESSCFQGMIGVGRWYRPVPPRRPSRNLVAPGMFTEYIDAEGLLKDISLKIITNFKIKKPVECFSWMPDVVYGVETPHRGVGFSGMGAVPAGGFAKFDNTVNRIPDEQKPEEQVRKYFPETWLWQLCPVGDSGSVELHETAPDTITDWNAGALCMGPSGFGFSVPASLRVFKSFFVDLTLPYSVIREESFTLKATVFTYLEDCIKVKVSLGRTEELDEEPCADCPRTSCLCADESKTFYWNLKATKPGEVNITVRTEALDTQDLCHNERPIVPKQGSIDTIIKPLLVQAQHHVHKAAPIREPSEHCGQSQHCLNDTVPDSFRRECVYASFPVRTYTINMTYTGTLVGMTMHTICVSEIFCACNRQTGTSYYTHDASQYCGLVGEPEGILEEKSHSSLLCIQKDQAQSAEEEISLKLPQNFVKDSVRGHVTVLGDLMGTAMQNLDRLLAMPYGCGEQNMVLFAPNIFILEYLANTHQLNEANQAKGKRFLESGYQRQLTYKHDDGSYSAFGKSDQEGNTWLTAFVVKSFNKAHPYIFIDETHLKHSITWLTNHRHPNGCFQSVGKLFNNAMKGGVEDETSLSAYVATALMESGVSKEAPLVRDALSCLREAAVKVSNVYTQALLAYTFTLAGETGIRQLLLKKLEKQAVRKDGQLHWERPSTKTTSELSFWYRAPSAEVELTSYMLMTELSGPEKDLGRASEMVNWLSKQQNPNGGFASTQDTVVALQALAQYAEATYSDAGDVTVTVRSQIGVQEFHVDNKNRLLLQTMPLPDIPGDYTLTATGSGCVYVQTVLRYNVPPPKSDATFAISVEVKPDQCPEEPVTKLQIQITAEYTGSREKSNMALIEMNMLSGFVPVKSSVRELEKKKQIQRGDIQTDMVALYLDELGHKPIQLVFLIEKDFDVKNLKPAATKIYDYYENSEYAVTEYNSPCGSDEKTTN